MGKFITHCLVFVLLLLLFDRLVFQLLQTQRPEDYKLFLESKKDFFGRNEEFDLLIVGDSHIADALDPRILEQKTGLKSFNLGVYHSSPYENYYLTLSALNHLEKEPRIVVLGTNPKMFQRRRSKGKYTPLIIDSHTAPLTWNSEEGFDRRAVFKTIQEQHLYAHVLNKLRGKKYQPTREIRSVYNGHLEFYNQMKDAQWSAYEVDPEVIPCRDDQVAYFRKTIELLQSRGAEVLIVNPPIWFKRVDVISKGGSFKEFEVTLTSIASEYDLEIYNPDHEILKDALVQQDFLNPGHLNYKGSEKFSAHFSEFLVTRKRKDRTVNGTFASVAPAR